MFQSLVVVFVEQVLVMAEKAQIGDFAFVSDSVSGFVLSVRERGATGRRWRGHAGPATSTADSPPDHRHDPEKEVAGVIQSFGDHPLSPAPWVVPLELCHQRRL